MARAFQVRTPERDSQTDRERLGSIFRDRMREMIKKTTLITQVRGKGLLNAIVVNDSGESDTAWNLCVDLMKSGLLAKPTHGNIIRLAPPLVITEEQIHLCCDTIEKCVLSFRK
jgi:ornithine--oxo-acid transaminase